jgi:hypothetical protein
VISTGEARLHRPTRRLILGALVGHAAVSADSDSGVLTSVKAMESRDSLALFTQADARFHRWRGAQDHNGGLTVRPAISPDGLAMCWGDETILERGPESPFLTVQSVGGGTRPIQMEGQVSNGVIGISSGAEIIVASALSIRHRGQRHLLALDLRSGLSTYDLTPFVTEFEVPDLEIISVSSSGATAALASRKQMQVIEIPSGKTVFTGPGRFPRLSPDGTRLAFIRKERLYTRSLLDGSTVEFLPEMRVMGTGGWSPDGRFLLAGAWTRFFAFEKRQIILDMTKRRYGVLGKLGDGDYGNQFAWISTKLLAQ